MLVDFYQAISLHSNKSCDRFTMNALEHGGDEQNPTWGLEKASWNKLSLCQDLGNNT